MRKFTILMLLSLFLMTVHGENPPQKISVAGRALSTQGKTLHEGKPRANLIFNSTQGSLSEEATLSNLRGGGK